MKSLIILVLLVVMACEPVYSFTKTEIWNTVNKFLCSDNSDEMASMIKFPVFFASIHRIYMREEFYREVANSSKQEGLYKLGKECIGFIWVVTEIEMDEYWYVVTTVPSNNNQVNVLVFIGKQGKIYGAIEDS